MRFTIATGGNAPDLPSIEQALQAVDPAALVDLDANGATLRISTWLSDIEIVTLVNQAGYPVRPQQLERVPSECCGGCGG